MPKGGTVFANPDNTNGIIRIGLIHITPEKPALSGSGALVCINFNVKSNIPDDDSFLSISQASFNSNAFMTVPDDGKVTVNTVPTPIQQPIKANTYYQLELFNLTLTIPAGAVTEDKILEVFYETSTPPLLGGLHDMKETYTLRFYGEASSTFEKPLILTFHYKDEQVPPSGTGTPFNTEESLRIYSQEGELWTFKGGTVDTQYNTVTVSCERFSTYSLLAGYAYGDVSGNGRITAFDASLLLQQLVGIIGELPALSEKSALLQNYPNPFNPETWIPYALESESSVEIRIYNAVSVLVRTLDLGVQPPGHYLNREKAAHWDGNTDTGERAANGVYFYELKTGDFTATRKLVILKVGSYRTVKDRWQPD